MAVGTQHDIDADVSDKSWQRPRDIVREPLELRAIDIGHGAVHDDPAILHTSRAIDLDALAIDAQDLHRSRTAKHGQAQWLALLPPFERREAIPRFARRSIGLRFP